ncbi:MAG TPA: biotin-dependent carboxyltransferase family protein [Solirubrobacteraceae bacterium]|nr:biotin-dependent carboxyltransferase family protein [Solirubrobacteraceae bacterium]
MNGNHLVVVRAGALTTVQDHGRPGLAHLAVPPSGALDREALALGNRLLGNPPGAAGLETTLDGVALRPDRFCRIVVTGAPAAVSIDGRPAAWAAVLDVPGGARLEVGAARAGLRSYVTVAGGVRTAAVLGSRSHDVLSGLGSPVLRAGDRLPLGERPETPPPPVDVAPQPAPPDALELTLWEGPRHGHLSETSAATLRHAVWTVASASNRIGLRLEGPALELAVRVELRSEGLVTGAVQVPPDGRPLIFLRDHPTTGGYPVIGVIDRGGLGACAQARPGIPVRFHPRLVRWAPGV